MTTAGGHRERAFPAGGWYRSRGTGGRVGFRAGRGGHT